MPKETPSNQPAEWLKQQARHVLWECDEYGVEPRFFLHANDRCYSEGFDILLKNTGLEPVRTPYEAPNANAVAEHPGFGVACISTAGVAQLVGENEE